MKRITVLNRGPATLLTFEEWVAQAYPLIAADGAVYQMMRAAWDANGTRRPRLCMDCRKPLAPSPKGKVTRRARCGKCKMAHWRATNPERARESDRKRRPTKAG